MNKSIFILFLIFSIITSCSEDILENQDNATESHFRVMSKNNNIISTHINNGTTSNCSSNILIFENFELVNETLELLRNNYKNHDNRFVQSYSNLNNDELFEKELELNHNPYETFEEFENSLNFCSLRQELFSETRKWLNNQKTLEGVDFMENPDNHFVFDLTERTILNEQNEIIIGDTLYKLDEKGYYKFSIEEENYLMNVVKLNNGENIPLSYYSPYTFSDVGIPCMVQHNHTRYQQVTPKIKIKMNSQTHYNFFQGRTITSKTTAYKYRPFTGWDTYRTNIAAGYRGEISNPCSTVCDNFVPFNVETAITRSYSVLYKNRSNCSGYWTTDANPDEDKTSSYHYIDGNYFLKPLPSNPFVTID